MLIIDEFILTANIEPLLYYEIYSYLMDYEINKLKSKQISNDATNVDDNNFEKKIIITLKSKLGKFLMSKQRK